MKFLSDPVAVPLAEFTRHPMRKPWLYAKITETEARIMHPRDTSTTWNIRSLSEGRYFLADLAHQIDAIEEERKAGTRKPVALPGQISMF